MPVKQTWLIPNRVVHVRYWGDVSAEEIGNAYSVSLEFVRASTDTRQVHFIHDWTDWHTYPKNIMQIRKYINVDVTSADRRKIGWMVVFGTDNRLLSYLSRIITQITNISFRIFRDKEKAIHYLKTMDGSLKDLDFSIINDIPSETKDDEAEE